MLKGILGEFANVAVFFIQISVFFFIFTGFVNHLDPQSELSELTLSIACKSGLMGLLLLLSVFSFIFLFNHSAKD